MERWLGPDVNPRDAKEALGKAIVSQYRGEASADAAAAEFRRRSAGQDPADIPGVEIGVDQLDAEGKVPAPKLLVLLGLESSTSNARRVIEQGGVNVGPGRVAVSDPRAAILAEDGLVVRVGKRKIARVVIGRHV